LVVGAGRPLSSFSFLGWLGRPSRASVRPQLDCRQSSDAPLSSFFPCLTDADRDLDFWPLCLAPPSHPRNPRKEKLDTGRPTPTNSRAPPCHNTGGYKGARPSRAPSTQGRTQTAYYSDLTVGLGILWLVGTFLERGRGSRFGLFLAAGTVFGRSVWPPSHPRKEKLDTGRPTPTNKQACTTA
jgi:hypothetical protein